MVDEAFLVKMAVNKKAQWGGIWKSVKNIDKDSNGFVTTDELDEIFHEWFPFELEGKSLRMFMKKYQSINNKTLLHYKRIKEEMNKLILGADKNEVERRQDLRDSP